MISKISCGVVIYDEISDIKRLIPLLKSELSQIQVEWVFILNHEESEIRQWIKTWILQNLPEAICLENPSNNLGYARQLVLEQASLDYIYMTDPDIELIPGSLNQLIHLAESDDILKNQPPIIGYSGTLLHKSNNSFLQNTYDVILKISKNIPFAFQTQQHSGLEKVDHIPSCHILLKKNDALKIGGFSPLFSKVGEDLDFSHRAYNENYRFSFLPTSQAIHYQNFGFDKWLYKVFLFGKVQIAVQKKNHSKGLRYYRLLPLVCLLGLVGFSILWTDLFYLFMFIAFMIGFLNIGFLGFILTFLSYSLGEFFEILSPTTELKNEAALQALNHDLASQVLKTNTSSSR